MKQNNKRKIDRFFLLSVSVLTLVGFVIFLSASLGLLAKDGANFNTVALKQTVSLIIGIALFFVFSRIPYQIIRKSAFFIFLGALAINILLFIPKLSLYHGGASRWIDLGFVSFQPSEFLKIAFIIYLAAWIYYAKDRISSFRFGLLPYIMLMAILSLLLLAQNDIDTIVVIGFTGLVMLFISGLKFKHLILLVALLCISLAGVVSVRPDRLDRIKTYLNRSADTQGSGYQINQSLIAIGSGQIYGRGFGQSVQKFGYIPEPIGDSIFAVAAEEFGFIGSLVLLSLYILLALNMFRIGARSQDSFAAMVAIGIGILIITESFMNMSAMLGLIPLSGMPLLFISHGGTALIIILIATGIVANISKFPKNSM